MAVFAGIEASGTGEEQKWQDFYRYMRESVTGS
jgi:hypothetical protein